MVERRTRARQEEPRTGWRHAGWRDRLVNRASDPDLKRSVGHYAGVRSGRPVGEIGWWIGIARISGT